MPYRPRRYPAREAVLRAVAYGFRKYREIEHELRKFYRRRIEEAEREVERLLGKYYREYEKYRELFEELFEEFNPRERYWRHARGFFDFLDHLFRIVFIIHLLHRHSMFVDKLAERPVKLILELVRERIINIDLVKHVLHDILRMLEHLVHHPELIHELLYNTSLICHEYCESSRAMIRHLPNIRNVVVYIAFKRYISDDVMFALPTSNPEASSLEPISDVLRKPTLEGFTTLLWAVEIYASLYDTVPTVQSDTGLVWRMRRMYEVEYMPHRVLEDYAKIYGRREVIDEMIHCSTYYMPRLGMRRQSGADMLRQYEISVGRFRIYSKRIWIFKT